MTGLVFDIAGIYTPHLNFLSENLGRNNTEFEIICLTDDFGHYYQFTSEILNFQDKPDLLHQKGSQLIQLLNGILFLTYEQLPKKINLGELYIDENKIFFDKKQSSNSFTVEAFLDARPEKIGLPIADILQLCKTDDNLRDLIFILGSNLDYNELYMAYEALGSIMGNLRAIDLVVGEALAGKLNEFTATANNFNAIGIKARHRKVSYEIPKKIVDLTVAKSIIKSAARIIIEHNYGILIPFVKEVKFNSEDLFEK